MYVVRSTTRVPCVCVRVPISHEESPFTPSADPGVRVLDFSGEGSGDDTVPREKKATLDVLTHELGDILEQSKKTAVTAATDGWTPAEKKKWWEERYCLDGRMQRLLDSLELDVFGMWKVLLMGSIRSPTILSVVSATLSQIVDVASSCMEASSVDRDLLSAILEGAVGVLDQNQTCDLVVRALGAAASSSSAIRDRICAILGDWFDRDADVGEREHSVLVVAEYLQAFPLESMPCLRKHSVSRVPTLSYLSMVAHGAHASPDGSTSDGSINVDRVFYVLNPSGDLGTTQKNLEPWLRRWVRVRRFE